jgi:hypothetical protein
LLKGGGYLYSPRRNIVHVVNQVGGLLARNDGNRASPNAPTAKLFRNKGSSVRAGGSRQIILRKKIVILCVNC